MVFTKEDEILINVVRQSKLGLQCQKVVGGIS